MSWLESEIKTFINEKSFEFYFCADNVSLESFFVDKNETFPHCCCVSELFHFQFYNLSPFDEKV